MIVMKFGGSSVENASAMLNVFKIVSSEKRKRVVVLSACKGITDLLLDISKIALHNLNEAIDKIEKIKLHHQKIIDDLIDNEHRQNVYDEVFNIIKTLKNYAKGISYIQELTPKMQDFFISFGEKLSTILFYYLTQQNNLNSFLINSEDIIKTNDNYGNALPDFTEIRSLANLYLIPLFQKFDIIIAQGFIGSDKLGNTTTLGRGGSDFSASIYGYAIGAEEVQIWTDVTGVKSADPRLINDAITIDEMSINEVRELSFYGAKVLHPDTIKPAIEAGIPIKVLNTFFPQEKGTLIKDNIETKAGIIHSITVLKEIFKLNFSFKPNISNITQLMDILASLQNKNIKILSSAISETSLVIFSKLQSEILYNLKATYIDYNLEISEGDLICIIGNNLLKNNNMTKIFEKVDNNQIDFLLFGVNNHSAFIFTVENSDEIIKKIHSLIEN